MLNMVCKNKSDRYFTVFYISTDSLLDEEIFTILFDCEYLEIIFFFICTEKHI